MNNNDNILELRVRRLLAAQTRLGRLKLDAMMILKRFSWLALAHSTRVIKRSLDIVFATIALIITAPAMIVIALLVKRDGGPVFFRQMRVGYLGREFGIWKFRSMGVDAEAELKDLLNKNEKAQGVTFKLKNDPRVTPIGRFIRRASIDELPQFFNVLAGEMSIVGPRPPLPREVALYNQEDRRRLFAMPGITCLWQVGEREGRTFEIGDRNAIDFDEQVALDVRYIEQQSALKDLCIMIKTLPAMLLGK
ncbi:exopolysaccharide biosynthesis polyprenyl glycosylphosphotransferase [soil metagenome]